MTQPNPLLDIGFQIPFDRVRPEHAQEAVDTLIERSRADLEKLAKAPERGYKGFIEDLDTLGQQLWAVSTVVDHLNSVVSSDEWRKVQEAILPKISTFQSEITLHVGLWQAMKGYAKQPQAAQLGAQWQHFLKKELDSFRRNGADLSSADKAKLTALDIRLAEITNQYAQNVMDGIKAYELYVPTARLAGVPERLQEATRADAELHGQPGMHRLTLHAPTLQPILTYAHDRSLREELFRANNQVGIGEGRDNRLLLPEILRLRRERAQLLGFATFADLVLSERMAGSGQAARDFEQQLEAKTRPAFERENAELEAFYRAQAGNGAPALEPWDVAYWAEKQRQAKYDFDGEQLRPYFPMPQVLSGLFEICQRIFGITVREDKAPGWHPDVKYYSIDNEQGQHIASFYTDWYPRDNKRGGAWMNAFYTGKRVGTFEPHLGLMCGNMNPPSGDTPSLLSLDEVETVFHEFGHLLHHALSHVEVQSLSGTNVPWDFVELPSQIMENWVTTPEGMGLIARHYQTGEGLPQELFDKMMRARNFRAANFAMRQYSFGTVDLLLHTEYAETDGDITEYARNVLSRFGSVAPLPDSAFIAQFNHLFSSPVGYAAGYYSYKWAEVLDADAFSRFATEGVFNRSTGADFVEHILSRGGTADPAQLYRNFMGRDPDQSALLRRSGLL